MKDKNTFYMMCTRETVGTNASFHCKDGHGYSTDIDKAHIYTLEEAQRAWDLGRIIDQPILSSAVDSMAVYHVDHQYLREVTKTTDSNDYYVGYIGNKFNGNDIYFLGKQGIATTDLNNAMIFSKLTLELSKAHMVNENIIWLPHEVAHGLKRRTFQISLFNPRKMVQGAGLKIPDHIKRYRRCKDTSKTRWNCPSCGKINWQENPYDFEGCSDWKCEEHRGY